MEIYYCGADITPYISANGFELSIRPCFRSSLRFALLRPDVSAADFPSLAAGGEVRAVVNGSAVFGGIVTSLGYGYFGGAMRVNAVCEGYEQICRRRVVTGFSSSGTTAGAVSRDLFDYALAAEGISTAADSFDSGVSVSGYSSEPARLGDLFDDIAATSGMKWWITPSKVFYMRSSIDVGESGLYINANTVSDKVRNLTLTKTLSGYRNSHTAVGNGVWISARTPSEESRMAALFGTGKYGGITVNKRLESAVACGMAASAVLGAHNTEPETLRFDTGETGAALYSRVWLRDIGANIYQPYVVKEIKITLKNGFDYSVTAERYDPNVIRP